MLFTERRDDAERLSTQTVAKLKELGLAPTPQAYTVWYAYHSGAFPDLTRAIDILISNRQSITDERCAELFRGFFGIEAEQQAVRSAGDKLLSSLESVLASLTIAGADALRYGDVLADASGKLSIAATLEQLKALVKGVAAETAAMAEKNRTLQSKLSENATEIETMRRDLETVRKESLTDALTGIANRKRFDDFIRDSAGQAMNSGKPMCLVMIDIDHFKKFNDTHGHVAGDQVLKLVGRILGDSVRPTDLPARYGGEEFAVVMPATSVTECVNVAERIRTTIASRKIVKRTTGESMGTITLSLGVARYRPGESLAGLIQRADAALYKAKTGGRNRVETAKDEPGPKPA